MASKYNIFIPEVLSLIDARGLIYASIRTVAEKHGINVGGFTYACYQDMRFRKKMHLDKKSFRIAKNLKKTIYEWLFYSLISIPVILFFISFAIIVIFFFIGLCLALVLDLIFKLIYFRFKKPSWFEFMAHKGSELQLLTEIKNVLKS